MAGIGFTLRKVIGKGSIGGTVGAILSGIFIVAGPWLISLISMLIIQTAFLRFKFGEAGVFQVSVLYSYAVSLSLFSGVHHHFTRIVSDLAWEGKHGQSTTWMLRFALFVMVLSIGIGGLASSLLPYEAALNAFLYKISLVTLFGAINVLWIVMLFISLLRDYRTISLVFGFGMVLSIIGALYLSSSYGAAGAVLGYAFGILLIDMIFILMGIKAHPPVIPDDGWSAFPKYAKKYSALIFSGFFFYAGQWLDKFYFWLTRGTAVPGTVLRTYDVYDMAVYIAGLSIIPGLVYFIIITETQLYTDLRHFLFSLNHSSWTRIQRARQRLNASLKYELRDQSLLQLACTLAIAFVLLRMGFGSIAKPELWLSLGAAYAQFTLLTILVFQYYFELYRRALATAALYFFLNGLGGVVLYTLVPDLPAGVGHLLAGSAACVVGYTLLRRAVYRIDRIIFRRALG